MTFITDPLGFKPAGSDSYDNLSPEFVNIRNKELNNGRLAMIAVIGIIAQELRDGLPILEHYAKFGLGPCT